MSQIERVASEPAELIGSARRRSLPVLVNEVSADLTPLQRHKLRCQIARQRRNAILEIAEIENKAIVAEADGMGRTHVAICRECDELTIFEVRTDCLEHAGTRHEDTAMSIGRLSEDSRAIFGNGLNAVAMRYVQGVERRARAF
jgi:hypothetical protein